jgi:hypothetical protein
VSKEWPKNGILAVCAQRRAGKTGLVESLLQEMRGRWTAVFLFSATMNGFDSIPTTYKFRSLNLNLKAIISRQQQIREHNIRIQKLRKRGESDEPYIKSRVLLVLDDMMATGELKSSQFDAIALNGRHVVGDRDPQKNNELSVVVIGQRMCGLSKTTRSNLDILISDQ